MLDKSDGSRSTDQILSVSVPRTMSRSMAGLAIAYFKWQGSEVLEPCRALRAFSHVSVIGTSRSSGNLHCIVEFGSKLTVWHRRFLLRNLVTE
jgi:hypothetical protein